MNGGRLDAIVAQMAEMVDEISVAARAQEEAEAGHDSAVAAANRAGERGPDWQTLQRRIDAGETTLADILGGRDDSPEALRVRAVAHARMVTLSDDLAAQAAEDDHVVDPRAEAEQLRADLEARIASLNDRWKGGR